VEGYRWLNGCVISDRSLEIGLTECSCVSAFLVIEVMLESTGVQLRSFSARISDLLHKWGDFEKH
jgi:hypothetical protein